MHFPLRVFTLSSLARALALAPGRLGSPRDWTARPGTVEVDPVTGHSTGGHCGSMKAYWRQENDGDGRLYQWSFRRRCGVVLPEKKENAKPCLGTMQ